MSGCPFLPQQNWQQGGGSSAGIQSSPHVQPKGHSSSRPHRSNGSNTKGRNSGKAPRGLAAAPAPAPPQQAQIIPSDQNNQSQNAQQSASEFVFLGPSSVRPYVRDLFQSFCRQILPGWVIDTRVGRNNDLIEESVAKLVHVLSTSMRANKRMLINSLTNACVITDYRGNITSWNNAAELAFGWTQDEITGKNIKMLIADEHVRSNHDHWLAQYHKTRKSKIIGYSGIGTTGDHKAVPARQMKGLRKDGSQFWLMLGVSEIQLHEGEPSFVASITDISELQEKRQQAEQMSKDLMILSQNLWGFFTAIFDATCEVYTDGNFAKVIQSSPQYNDFGLKYLEAESMEGADLIDYVPPEERSRFKQYLASFVTASCNPPVQTVAPKILTHLANPRHRSEPITVEIFAMRIESGCSSDQTRVRLGFRLLTDVQVKVPTLQHLEHEEEHDDHRDDITRDDFSHVLPASKISRTKALCVLSDAAKLKKRKKEFALLHPRLTPGSNSKHSSHGDSDLHMDERMSLHSELHSLPEEGIEILSKPETGSDPPKNESCSSKLVHTQHKMWDSSSEGSFGQSAISMSSHNPPCHLVPKGVLSACSSSSSVHGLEHCSLSASCPILHHAVVDNSGDESALTERGDHEAQPLYLTGNSTSVSWKGARPIYSEDRTIIQEEPAEGGEDDECNSPTTLPVLAQASSSAIDGCEACEEHHTSFTGGNDYPSAKESMLLSRRCLSDADIYSKLNVGSSGHPDVCRKPCKYFWIGGCRNGEQCSFCHLPHTMHAPRLDKRHRYALEKLEPARLYEIFGNVVSLKAAKYRQGAMVSEVFQELHKRAVAVESENGSNPNANPHRANRRMLGVLESMTLGHLLHKLKGLLEQKLSAEEQNIQLPKLRILIQSFEGSAGQARNGNGSQKKGCNRGLAGMDQKQFDDDHEVISTASI
eukprot:gnl/MRDRNA2_/MRDRNA2_86686_c0_seq1.p1 gnl/MRDRNA2_/MRDRNA2_86686_c0~~gnl/MRDRNA2_/MRDRNA2_86686_c0_seq1.p1  ORF type:complete len:934 (+),score=149.52 gnl/MRDRNA2_/MRDRNA2_86686_c0_seq1:86-2887(+)